ncbi:MAG TPA: c-type cytochrome, partial [Vicinamibacterales bacterium]|nr:c-type cytochrome [Vicinamibacterales bacterium]
MKPWKALVVGLLSIAAIALILATGLVSYVIFWSGLRATAEPSALESAVARTVRNWAIPRAERRATNPLQATAENVRAGRDAFLVQCAGCHGYDGSGLTPIGRNLYPRAPNLRDAGTQALSDGALHYIIENGVPLTGMAAWSNPHQASNSWSLALFIRSLGANASTAAAHANASNGATASHYVGSKACEACHADEYRRWSRTPMANIVRPPAQVVPALFTDPSKNAIFPFDPHDVAFVYGSLWKQRFFKKVGDDYFPLPVQW